MKQVFFIFLKRACSDAGECGDNGIDKLWHVARSLIERNNDYSGIGVYGTHEESCIQIYHCKKNCQRFLIGFAIVYDRILDRHGANQKRGLDL